jgi:aspartyl-tRNA(Asn)/glutamyl-tRNA(Gln) amidotransferase subunit C
MKLSREEVQHIAWLARLGLSEAEVEKFSIQLSDILGNFEILKQVDTDKVQPATHSVPLQDVFREDRTAESLPQSKILSNAPSQEEDCFKVQAILE